MTRGVAHGVLRRLLVGFSAWVAGAASVVVVPVVPSSHPGALLQRLPAEATGIRFTNRVSMAQAMENNNLLNGAGLALGDVNGDGLPDLYLCQLDGPNALYVNRGGFRFEPVPAAGGAACADGPSSGAVLADLDGNGSLDLVVTSVTQPARLFLNDGTGTFAPVAQPGFASHPGSSSVGVADANGDGLPDLYLAHYAGLSILRSGGAIPMRMVDGRPQPSGPHARRLRIVGGRLEELGEPDQLCINRGSGRFEPVPWTNGFFLDERGEALREAPMELGLSVLFRDLNGDGWPDLYVCNDFDFPDRIWINERGRRFRALPSDALRRTSHFSMAVDAADIDRDGWDDLFVVDMASRSHRLRMTQSGPLNQLPRPPGEAPDRAFASHNTLLLNRGDGTYAEIAHAAGVHASEWSWATVFLDVDLDGFEDILVGNGHAHDILDLDTMERIEAFRRQGRPTPEQVRETLAWFPPLGATNVAFQNQRDRTFRDASHEWGFVAPEVTHGLGRADLDGDGDLDVVLNCLNAPPVVYRNNAPGPRLAVRLKGLGADTHGLGARLTVHGGPVTQSQVVMGGGRYLSGDEALRVFAAGTEPLSVTIDWPDGTRQVHSNLPPNSRVTMARDPAATRPPAPPPRPSEPLFTDVSGWLGHRHQEVAHDDFAWQPLLPRKLTQPGPVLAWSDLDQDGWPDLVVGHGAGRPPDILRNRGGTAFAPPASAAVGAPGMFSEDVSGLVVTMDGPGARPVPTILAALTAGEGEPGSRVAGMDGGGTQPAREMLRLDGALGPLAMADVNGDGRPDLFAGTRFRPGRYPESDPSALFLAQADGIFRRDATQDEVLARAGLVRGACWSDLDGDGRPDLVLACEWGPVRVLMNRGGRLVDETDALGLGVHTGWWNGVATGDFDGDGRPDIVASNWGNNSAYQATATRPVWLFHDDLNRDGTVDVLEAYVDGPGGRLVPRRNRVVLGAALPLLRRVIPSHAAFAELDIPGILRGRQPTVGRLHATTLLHAVFLNRGGRFEPVPLPQEAQWSPACGMGVADFDGDGREDLVLAQNFFATVPDHPRMDAGQGLLLRGDGRGGFDPVSPRESGVRVPGEQRGVAVADFNQDGRPDIAIGQNGGGTRLFLNHGGRSGLAVELVGPPGNRAGIGARLQWRAEDGFASPLREVQAGSGNGCQSSPVQVLHLPPGRLGGLLRVTWPDGMVQSMPVGPEGRRIRVVRGDAKPGG